ALVADSLADYLERHPEMRGTGEISMFLTTGDPQRVTDQATRFLRRKTEFHAA
ncbi:MAG: glutamate racemase, partial [Boseongicola sp. SB0662_bin_57]|nr:glutamate racemase [Boseongicola sp. SB0662_bin_57]